MNSNNNIFSELLIPARMLNEYAYCPRLFYLEWVQNEFTHSEDTLYGKLVHKKVDKESENTKELEEIDANNKIHSRSITLSSYTLGFIAVLDLIENEGKELIPVDYKKGAIPNNEEKTYEPDRVQLCVQALLLRDNGYQCKEGVIYYAQSKTRVTVPITDDLIKRTLQLRDEARQVAVSGRIPPPLIDSPKCPRCSLVGICLPDEVSSLSEETESIKEENIRRLFPARDDALPIYVQEQGAVITKNGEEIEIKKDKEILARAKLFETSSVHIFGNVQITTQTVHELLEKNIPICYYSYGGWFYGMTQGISHKNIQLRQRQFYAASDQSISLQLSKRFVIGKIRNSRTMLRRNCESISDGTLNELYTLSENASTAKSIEELLGIEGAAARIYFSNFDQMLKKGDDKIKFEFIYRNRRPPKDPVNAILSYVYSLLASTFTTTLMIVGFDPFLGFFHRPRYGRPSLALDMMEEFRPLIADSTVINLINNREITTEDMIITLNAVSLQPEAKKKVIKGFERRLDTLITHPLFGYSISYRRVLEVQARLLGRYLTGEIKEYPVFLTR